MELKEFVIEHGNLIDDDNFAKLFKVASTELDAQNVKILTNMLIELGMDVTTGLKKLIPQCYLQDTKIKNITIPEGVVSIGCLAFNGCKELVSIQLPSTLRNSYLAAFEDCLSLKDVYFNGTLEDWCKIRFTYSSSHPLRNVTSNHSINMYINNSLVSGKITLPSSIERINKFTFQHFSVEEIIFPTNISTIDEYAFMGVPLKKIIIQNNNIAMKTGSFYNCGTIEISFNGTKEDWKQIYNSKAFENTYFTVNCIDGKIVKKKK